MRTCRTILMIAAACGPLGCLCRAQAPAPARSFDTFRMVRVRNIFDPNRIPGATTANTTAAGPPPPPAAEQPKATDYVVLTGVMVDGGQALAFFSGSRPDYDKVTDLNGEIAGAKVTKIAPNGIEVERAGKRIIVAVGQTVPFDNSAPGAPPPGAIDIAGVQAAPTTGAGDNSSTSNPLPGNMSEVMRRMMARRQQQLQ